MKIDQGSYETEDGTEVIVVQHQLSPGVKPYWIGYIKRLGEGNAQGVMSWFEDGSVANLGSSTEFKNKMKLKKLIP